MDHRDRFQAHPLPSRRAEAVVLVVVVLTGAALLLRWAWEAVAS